MIDISALFTQIISSSVVAGIVGFVASTLFKQHVERIYKKQEALLEARLSARVAASDALFDKELAVYPEIIELVYRCRNLARESLSQDTRTPEVISAFSQYTIHFNENLYKYRLFFDDKSFRRLHRMKVEVQEFRVLLNEVTRSEHVQDAPVDRNARELAESQMKERFNTIDKVYGILVDDIKEMIQEKASLESTAL